MKILLTGATGYIGKRLMHEFLEEGHELVCVVRDSARLPRAIIESPSVQVVECDFLDPESLVQIPADIEVAYYLIHSMSGSIGKFKEDEKRVAINFRSSMERTSVKQVIYLSAIVNQAKLSRHLISRKAVEDILSEGSFHLTTLRAGIIVGSGSASFEIIRDLVEKLPLMVAPKWLNTNSQPIAVRNVLQFLKGVLAYPYAYGKSFDIGGPEIVTYKEMLLRFAAVRKLRRKIWIVPVMTPKLSSYWLYFITSTSYKLAVNLVDSMKIEVVCRPNDLAKRLKIELISYENAVQAAFDRIEQHSVISSWTDAQSSNILDEGVSHLLQVPVNGCFTDSRRAELMDPLTSLERIWTIGGETGWYYANWLWRLRGFLDKMNGGVGLRRGRKSNTEINAGDSLDFWRVIYANKDQRRLLLYAEMKLPGEAWLEYKIEGNVLEQTATFRPLGLKGRLYWYSVLIFHVFVFRGMIKRIAETPTRINQIQDPCKGR